MGKYCQAKKYKLKHIRGNIFKVPNKKSIRKKKRGEKNEKSIKTVARTKKNLIHDWVPPYFLRTTINQISFGKLENLKKSL